MPFESNVPHRHQSIHLRSTSSDSGTVGRQRTVTAGLRRRRRRGRGRNLPKGGWSSSPLPDQLIKDSRDRRRSTRGRVGADTPAARSPFIRAASSSARQRRNRSEIGGIRAGRPGLARVRAATKSAASKQTAMHPQSQSAAAETVAGAAAAGAAATGGSDEGSRAET
jgi:hypothetical protein